MLIPSGDIKFFFNNENQYSMPDVKKTAAVKSRKGRKLCHQRYGVVPKTRVPKAATFEFFE